jgi:hypothetical protein
LAPVTAVCTIGGLLVEAMVATAASRSPRPSHTGILTAAVALLTLLVAAGTGTHTYLHNRPPFSAAAAHLRASVRLTDASHFTVDQQALGIHGLELELRGKGGIAFVGAVTFGRPPGSGIYSVVVVDRNSNRICPVLYDANGSYWDSFLDAVPDRYPWLDAMRQPQASTVLAQGSGTAPIAFTGSFTDPALTGTGDLLVAVVYSGSDGQIYWASRVPITLTN